MTIILFDDIIYQLLCITLWKVWKISLVYFWTLTTFNINDLDFGNYFWNNNHNSISVVPKPSSLEQLV